MNAAVSFTVAAMYLRTCELVRLPSKKWNYIVRHAHLQSLSTCMPPRKPSCVAAPYCTHLLVLHFGVKGNGAPLLAQRGRPVGLPVILSTGGNAATPGGWGRGGGTR